MMLHPKWRVIFSAVLVALLCSSAAAIAGIVNYPASKKLQIEFFTYNPTRKADLDCFFEEHKGRLAATIKQNHQVGESAAGTIVNGLLGARAQNLTLQLDLSDDTVVTDRAWWVLYTLGKKGYRRHIAAAEEFSNSFSSGPCWTTYQYNAGNFHPSHTDLTPSIDPSDKVFKLCLSLVGRQNAGPITHTFHWATHPVINGEEIVNFKTKIKRLDDRDSIWPGNIP